MGIWLIFEVFSKAEGIQVILKHSVRHAHGKAIYLARRFSMLNHS